MAEREYVLYDDDGNSVWEPDGKVLLEFIPSSL
jgi:hypothetical protein